MMAGWLNSKLAAHQDNPQARGVAVAVGGYGDESRIHLVRGCESRHSLDLASTTPERLLAHLQGFAGFVGVPLPKKGDACIFRRGMFGTWTGRVEHAGHRRDGLPYFLVSFVTRSGHRNQRRIELTGMHLRWERERRPLAVTPGLEPSYGRHGMKVTGQAPAEEV